MSPSDKINSAIMELVTLSERVLDPAFGHLTIQKLQQVRR